MFRYSVVNQMLEADGRTRKWFAEKVGTPKGAMDLYLSGHREPSLRILARMASILGCQISSLIEDRPLAEVGQGSPKIA